MMPRVFIYRRKDGLWDWRLVASNGDVMATSGGQGYTERNDAEEGWNRVDGAIWVSGQHPESAKAIHITYQDGPPASSDADLPGGLIVNPEET